MNKKNFTLLLTVLMSMVGLRAFAHDIAVANNEGKTIYYVWTNNNTELAVSCKGTTYSSYDNEYSGDIIIPKTVLYNGHTYNVTSVINRAFYECTNLTSVTIPSSISLIGEGSFAFCSNLESLNIEEEGPELKIEGTAFYSCTKLKIIPDEIPYRVTSIGSHAFDIGSAFSGISYGELIYLGRVAYHFKSELSGGTNYQVFSPDVVIKDGTTCIADNCFSDCYLQSISIPNTVREIGSFAFGSSQLSTITIPSSVTSIGHALFNNSYSPRTIIVEAGNPVYDSRNNCNAIIETQTNTLIDGCRNTVIPEDVTSIGEYAFYNIKGLTTIKIPKSISAIGYSAFQNCKNLTSVTSRRIDPVSIGTQEFRNISDKCRLYIPQGLTTAYTSKGWTTSVFKGGIEEVGKAIQTLEMTSIPTMTYGDAAYTLPQTTNEGLTLTWEVSNTNIATVSSNILTIKGAGTTTVTATQAGNDDYEEFSRDYTLTVNPKNASNLTISISAVTYNGSALTPTVTVKDGSATLTSGTDYTAAYSDNTNAGTATVTITGTGNYTGTKNGNFTINKAPLTITAKSYTINQKDDMPAFEVTYDGFKNSETSSVLTTLPTITCDASDSETAGDFDITPSGAAATNYSFNYVSGTLTINEITSVSIAINSLGKGTYCSKFPIDFTGVSGIEAYIISGFDPSAGKLIRTRVYEVPAETGLFIIGTPGATFNIPVKETDFYYANLMKGITVATVIPTYEENCTNFILASNGNGGVYFTRSNGYGTTAANRAYVQIPTSLVGAREFLDIEDDNDSTTGLDGVFTPDTKEAEGDYYNLSGQKVQTPRKGIYIKNGKKIFIH